MAVSKEDLTKSLSAVRMPIGPIETREMANSNYSTSLPGAPDGEYFVIQFNSSFANKLSAIETVATMRDPNGVWRVAGYFIK